MDFIRPHLSRNEAEVCRQVFTNGIDFFFNTCPQCKTEGGGGCSFHSRTISTLRNLRQRFDFRSIDAPPQEQQLPVWCRRG